MPYGRHVLGFIFSVHLFILLTSSTAGQRLTSFLFLLLLSSSTVHLCCSFLYSVCLPHAPFNSIYSFQNSVKEFILVVVSHFQFQNWNSQRIQLYYDLT